MEKWFDLRTVCLLETGNPPRWHVKTGENWNWETLRNIVIIAGQQMIVLINLEEKMSFEFNLRENLTENCHKIILEWVLNQYKRKYWEIKIIKGIAFPTKTKNTESVEKWNGFPNLYHFIPADDAVFVDVIEPEAPQNFLLFRSFAQGW